MIHCFELRTANVSYYVGEEPIGKKDGTPVVNPPESGIGLYLAKVSVLVLVALLLIIFMFY